MTAARGALGAGDESAGTPPVTDERLVFSANGSTLTGGSHGAGGSATWVGTLDSSSVIGAGAEYQRIADAHWTAGTLSASHAFGHGDLKTHLYLDLHEGAGDIGNSAFHYSQVTAGVLSALTHRWSVQIEERRIDIDTSHGNLPKLGISFRATPRLLASVSYANSVGGNLGTKLATARIDYTGTGLTVLAGLAGGHVAPSVVNLLGQVVRSAPTLTEGFAGVGKPLARTDWLLIGDYQDLDGLKRTAITLTCTVHLRAPGQGR